MTKVEFVKAVAEKAEVSQKAVKQILDVMQDVAYTEMAAQGEVKIFDGLTLCGVYKDAKIARNPLTGTNVDVAAKTVPKAKFGVAAKRIVNGEE